MAESNSFMAGKLRIPDVPKAPAQDNADSFPPEKQTKKSNREPEKPWVGTAALRNLSKKREEQGAKESADKSIVVSEYNNKKSGLSGLTELTELTQPVKSKIEQPTSPVRDFTKTPNSIGRSVMAKGLFKGKSKQIYDFLWTASRGSINPSRIVKKTHGEIQSGTGIGSLNTIKNGLKYLEQIGLIRKTSAVGEATGNTYETFTPEEVNLTDQVSPDRPVSSVSSVSQKMVQPVRPETGRTNLTQVVLESDNYSHSKTSFKDKSKNDDDSARVNEAFSVLAKRLDDAVNRITGKGVSEAEAEKWGTLADLLILELEVAASRADGVSSVPTFLTEILRRQFFASRQKQSSGKSAKTKTDTVGKPESNSYEIKPLDEKGKEAALEQLREFAGESFLEDFRKWYMPEDWDWLIEKLES